MSLLGPLEGLAGTWTGEGRGWYPTIADFGYREESVYRPVPNKPVLAYTQRTFHQEDGRPLHGETGYWRVTDAGTIELLLAHSNGFVEVSTVSLADSGELRTATVSLAPAPTAKQVTALRRVLRLDGDQLQYEMQMEAVGLPMQGHLAATLRRTGPPGG